MPRRDALVLLAVLGIGVFLAGLELMITAVALPAIVIDLADWTRLREASWIINGYLLVYVVTMPLAGRLADLWGARRLFLGALVAVHGRLVPGRDGADARAADRRPARPGGRRRRPRPGRDRRGVAPVQRWLATASPRRHRRADVPRHGGRARSSARRSWDRSTPRPRCRGWASTHRARSPAATSPRPGAGCSTSTSRSAIVAGRVVGRERAAGRRRAGRAAWTSSGAAIFSAVPRRACSARSRCSAPAPTRPAGSTRPSSRPRWLGSGCWRSSSRSCAGCACATRSSTRACSGRHRSRSADARLRAHGLRLRDGDRRRGGVRRPGALRRPGRAAPRARARSPARPRSARSRRASLVRVLPLRLVTLVGLGGVDRRPVAHGAAGRPRPASSRPRSRSASFGLGFGLTVTPRSTAAVEAVAREAYGIASSTVTVARMVGHGRRPRDPHGVRLDDHRPALRPGLRDAGRVPRVHPRGAPRPAAPRPARRRGARGVGRGRGGPDHGRRVPRGGRRDRGSPSRRRSCSTGGGVCSPRPRHGARPRAPAEHPTRMDAPTSPSSAEAAASRAGGTDDSHVAGRRVVERRDAPAGGRERAAIDARRARHADLGRPLRRRPGRGRRDRQAARAPPADRRGHRRAQPAGEGRGDGGHDPRRDVLRSCTRARSRRSRSTSSWAAAVLLTVHAPGWDPLTLPQLRGDIGSRPEAGRGLPAVRDHDGIVDGYFPVLDALDDEIDAPPGRRRSRSPTSWTLEQLFALKRELIGLRRAIVARARDLQPAHEPRPRADRPERTSSTSATCTTT